MAPAPNCHVKCGKNRSSHGDGWKRTKQPQTLGMCSWLLVLATCSLFTIIQPRHERSTARPERPQQSRLPQTNTWRLGRLAHVRACCPKLMSRFGQRIKASEFMDATMAKLITDVEPDPRSPARFQRPHHGSGVLEIWRPCRRVSAGRLVRLQSLVPHDTRRFQVC